MQDAVLKVVVIAKTSVFVEASDHAYEKFAEKLEEMTECGGSSVEADVDSISASKC